MNSGLFTFAVLKGELPELRLRYYFFAAFFLVAFFVAVFFLGFFVGSPPLIAIFSFSFLSDWTWSKDLETLASDPS